MFRDKVHRKVVAVEVTPTNRPAEIFLATSVDALLAVLPSFFGDRDVKTQEIPLTQAQRIAEEKERQDRYFDGLNTIRQAQMFGNTCTYQL